MKKIQMDQITQELTNLSNEFEEAKTVLAKLEGQQEELIKRLNELDIKNLEQAKKAIIKMDTEINDLEEEINKDFDQLKKEYSW